MTIDEELKFYGVVRRLDLGEQPVQFSNGLAPAFVERIIFDDGCYADAAVPSDLLAIAPPEVKLREQETLSYARTHGHWCMAPKKATP